MSVTTEPTSTSAPATVTAMVPHLCCRNAEDAAHFYVKALGAEIIDIYKVSTGQVMHGALKIGAVSVYLVDEFPAFGSFGPQSLNGNPVTFNLSVPDADAAYQRAVDAGCEVIMPICDMFWGDRYGLVKDPFGHKWAFTSPIREVSPDELRAFIANMPMDGEGCPASDPTV